MRILHVIHSVDPRSGGPSHAIRKLMQWQARADHEVALLSTAVQAAEPWAPTDEYRRAMLSDPSFAAGEVHLAAALGRHRPWVTYAFSPDASRWLRLRLLDPQCVPDVIHIHGTFSYVTNLAARLARRHGIPYLIRPAGILDAQCFGSGSRRMKRLFARLVLRQDLACAAAIHCMSPHEAQEMRRWVPPERIHVIPHGVETPQGSDDEARASFVSRFPRLAGRQVLLFLGRIVAKKRPTILVDALARLRDEFPRLVLLMAGHDDGALESVTAAARLQGIEDRVVLTGFLQGGWKRGALAVADVFGLPSIDENFGLAVVEAMAHGVPVVLTRGVATHREVEASGGGLAVEGTPEAFADGIRTLLNGDPKTAGLRGRRYVETHLSWPSIVAQLDSLYRACRCR